MTWYNSPRHIRQMSQVRIRHPRPVPTQVKCQNPDIKRWGSAWDANLPSWVPPESGLIMISHQTSQLPRFWTWPACQTKHDGDEGSHMHGICAVFVATDALHWRHDHRNRQTSGATIHWRSVPYTSKLILTMILFSSFSNTNLLPSMLADCCMLWCWE
jgi:hypothetical protein